MTLRSARERTIQTLAYEAGGLAISVPLYVVYSGSGAAQSLMVMLSLSAALLLWSPVHNLVFDWAELRLSGRVASDRPHGWRLVHAICHEMSSIIVTLPLLVWLGGHGPIEAVFVDLALTAVYVAYAYGFHMVFDWLRPVRPFCSGRLAS